MRQSHSAFRREVNAARECSRWGLGLTVSIIVVAVGLWTRTAWLLCAIGPLSLCASKVAQANRRGWRMLWDRAREATYLRQTVHDMVESFASSQEAARTAQRSEMDVLDYCEAMGWDVTMTARRAWRDAGSPYLGTDKRRSTRPGDDTGSHIPR